MIINVSQTETETAVWEVQFCYQSEVLKDEFMS